MCNQRSLQTAAGTLNISSLGVYEYIVPTYQYGLNYVQRYMKYVFILLPCVTATVMVCYAAVLYIIWIFFDIWTWWDVPYHTIMQGSLSEIKMN